MQVQKTCEACEIIRATSFRVTEQSIGKRRIFSGTRLSPWEQYCQLLLLTNEGMYID